MPSTGDSERFDPYHQWLGIAPKDQPPNHYRLLGVDLFEANPSGFTAKQTDVYLFQPKLTEAKVKFRFEPWRCVEVEFRRTGPPDRMPGPRSH